MQRHYTDILKSINDLTRTIRGSSLNKEEHDAVWGKLKRIEEQLLPLTLTWVPPKEEEEKPVAVEPVKKTSLDNIKERLEKLKLK